MAEFRGDTGGLEPNRGPRYRSSLLPWEQQFCDTLGISTDEYFEFYELVAQQVAEEEGRELIPDIRNEPVTIVTLVVGIALSAVGMLLAPKPRAPEQKKQGDPFQAQDVRGRTKFSPLTEFDSIQDLATLGSIVPLVYTERVNDHGGVRVESQLLWSRMRNSPTYQELRALLLFSAGRIDRRPEYEGYAFGDSRLTGYSAPKISLWFNPGLSKADGNKPFTNGSSSRYPEGTRKTGSSSTKPFFTSIPGDGKGPRMLFCGTVTPSQSAQFGQYSPIRNGHAWKYAFKWPGKGDGDGDKKEMLYGTRAKHVHGYHAGRTEMERHNGDGYKYTITDSDSDKIYYAGKKVDSGPDRATKNHFRSSGKLNVQEVMRENDSLIEDVGGLSEGLNAVNQSKIDADTALDTGELYLIGTDIYVCDERYNTGNVPEGTPYEPKRSGSVEYTFEREDEFYMGLVDDQYIRVDDNEDIHNEKHQPIQKVAIGAVSTTRAVDMVEIGFKSTVYRQINGYPNIAQFTYKDIADDYAKEQQSWTPGTIQTYYERLSLFRMQTKRGNEPWEDWSGDELFAVHGNNPQPRYNQILIKPPAKDFYEFRFIPVCGNAWIANGYYRDKDIYILNARKAYTKVATRKGYEVWAKGDKFDSINEVYELDHPLWATGEKERPNQNPGSLLNDYWFFDADSSSNENDPEHQITWVNEYVENDSDWYNEESKQYEHLAHAGLICRSSTEVGTFSNFTAYFTQGIEVEKLTKSGIDKTNNFPEIAFDLLTNRRYGVGEFIGRNAVDEDMFRVAAKFCEANGFYWDGVISKTENVRGFLFQQAAYQLLDFTIIGGRFSLYPAVPFLSDYRIDFGARPGNKSMPVKALFTNGNVRNFKCTFLSPEERALFIAEAKYRIEKKNGFPETHLVRVRLSDSDGGYSKDPIEVFDMTQFCTTREHAVNFAKYALRTRQVIDHSISFETTPDACHSLMPGDYIRVAVSIQHQERERGYTERLRSGSVAPNGTVQVAENVDLTSIDLDVFYWKPGYSEVRQGTLPIRNGVCTDVGMRGCLFTRKRSTSEARIYKIESIAYNEESFVEISGSYQPLTKNGNLKVLEWDTGDFVIEDQRD